MMADRAPSGLATRSIDERIAAVRARIERACERADRDPAGVQLIAVSKTHGVEAVRDALAAGVDTFGENRAQELVPKAQAAVAAGLHPAWHFLGHLQRNKVREVMPHISVLHSLDSTRLLDEIARHRADETAVTPLPCYIEVNVAGEAQKHGVAPAEVAALLERAQVGEHVRVLGLMTVAPHVTDPEQARPVFRALRELAVAHGLDELSMGMTDDFEVAIEEGATAVRVGRAIFGERG
jgi:hypothetical protein